MKYDSKKRLPIRVCKCGCLRQFFPRRSWQIFYNPEHQRDYHAKMRKFAMKAFKDRLNRELGATGTAYSD